MNTRLLKNVTSTEDGVIFVGTNSDLQSFENDYLIARDKEGRVFDDDLVKLLPYLPKQNQLSREWEYRASSLKKILNYLKNGKQNNTLLDIGCGNGWFCSRLKAELPGLNIYGLDVNTHELKQAARLNKESGITFVNGDIFLDNFQEESFNIINVVSTIQYFPDIKMLINRLLKLLTKEGEIHIIDSPFYSSIDQKNKAQQRSKDYFSTLGAENMIGHYHHHTFDELNDFYPVILYNSNKLRNMISIISGKKSSPFPWIRITKK